MNKPRVLLYDVETKPVRAWIWRVGNKIRIGHEQICRGEQFDIICIAYKWLGERKIHSLNWGLHVQDSTKMIDAFSKVVATADLAVGHNGDNFDLKQINTQRLIHNQPPIAWPTTEDTLKQFRRHFALPSYKLDYISKLLTGSGKDRMQFEDWLDIIVDKNPAALDKMLKYCKRDVLKLEQIYKRASVHFTPKIHAGKAAGIAGLSCPRCASQNSRKEGTKLRITGRYQRYKCCTCGTEYIDPKRIAL